MVARTRILREIGGLSEDRDLVAMEDYEAWLRTAKITDKFRKIPKTLGYYWIGGGNFSNPGRTLQTLDALQERYAKEMDELNVGTGPWWLNYSKGRAYYLLRQYAKAENELGKLQWRQVPLPISIKSLWMRSAVRFFHNSDIRPKDE